MTSFLSNLLAPRDAETPADPAALVGATVASASLLSRAARAKRAGETAVATTTSARRSSSSSEAAAKTTLPVEEAAAKAKEAIGKQLAEIRVVLIGDVDKDVDEERAAKVAAAAEAQNLARALASCVAELPLEACKSAAHVVANLMRRDDTGASFAATVVDDGATLETLVRAYPENGAEVALACGTMLREACKHEIVCAAILRSSSFWLVLTDYVHLKNFDVAADAFALLRCLLTGHPKVAAAFVRENYDFFFECYNRLLHSDNYVTCRESLRLLSDVLLDRAHYQTMIAYIANKDHLKILMLLMRSKKSRIQLEAFHVFKIFVANPNKTTDVARVLTQNKHKLIAYLADFHTTDTQNDAQFLEERHLVLDTLRHLPDVADGASTGGTPPPPHK
mmetsp:Transcript_8220/g.33834  ORF Transcript_8220/g.33834 Transcript_8220/m.33834 type:complete len:394 (+) Transcript_8220:323-1504(+)